MREIQIFKNVLRYPEMDIDDVSYRQVVEQLTELYSENCAVTVPIRERRQIYRITN